MRKTVITVLLVAGVSLLGVQSGAAQTITDGFSWKVPDRFGMLKANRVVEYHWDLITEDYDHSWINPNEFPVVFDACDETESASGRSTARRFEWTFHGPKAGDQQSGQDCRVTYRFKVNNTTYTASLKITSNGVTDVFGPYDIPVRDLLIVQIGDSYASGEGAPDLPRGDDDHPTWIDRRCHRSAKTGAAQAAIALEKIDQYSSVTFLSYACSGATIDTWIEGKDGAPSEGKGLLEPYRGMEVGLAHKPFVPAQVEMLPKREIDALIIGAGINDLHFSKIMAACVTLIDACHNETELNQRLNEDVTALPGKFKRLAERLNSRAIKHVFLTEYPDGGKDDSRQTCDPMMDDILWPGWSMSEEDVEWVDKNVLQALNRIARDAATAGDNAAGAAGPRWHFVTGISEVFQGSQDGRGHGYCADDNWIMTAEESGDIQGPDPDNVARLLTLAAIASVGITPAGALAAAAMARAHVALELKTNTGTMHPNEIGHRVVRDRMVEALARELFAANVKCKEVPGLAFMSGGIKCMPASDPEATDCTKFENDFERQACGGTTPPSLAKGAGGEDGGGSNQCTAITAEPDLAWTQVEATGPAGAAGTITLSWRRCFNETRRNKGLEDLPIFSWEHRTNHAEDFDATVTIDPTAATARVSARGKLTERLTEHAHTECNNRMTTMTNVLASRTTYAGAATIDATAGIQTTAEGYLILVSVGPTKVQVETHVSNGANGACQPPAVTRDETTEEVKGGIEIGVIAQRQGNTPELSGSWSGPAVNSIGQIGMLTVSWKLRLEK